MTITDSRLAGFQTALRGLATAADRFASDEDATRTLVNAVQTGDATQVSRALSRVGASTIAYAGRQQRPHLDEDPAPPTHQEVFRLVPADNERFRIDIEISIDAPC